MIVIPSSTMDTTWAEDRATLASDPSTDPGARPDGPTRCRPLLIRDGTKALNAPGSRRVRPTFSRPPAPPGSWAGPPPSPSAVALGCNRLCELRRCCRHLTMRIGGGRSDDAGPVIPIRRVAHSLRTASGTVACPSG